LEKKYQSNTKPESVEHWNANDKNNNAGLAARAPVSKTRYIIKLNKAYW
jgi:hypothetical protein